MINRFFQRFCMRISIDTLKIVKGTLDPVFFASDLKAFDKVIEILETLEKLGNIKVEIARQ